MSARAATPSPEPGTRPTLRAVPDVATAPEAATASRFSATVRTVVALGRRHGLRPPVFRSPPGIADVDRSIRRRPSGAVVVAIRRAGRPLPAVQADVIDGMIAANQLTPEASDRFRRAAWALLEGTPEPVRTRATMEPPPPARVA